MTDETIERRRRRTQRRLPTGPKVPTPASRPTPAPTAPIESASRRRSAPTSPLTAWGRRPRPARRSAASWPALPSVSPCSASVLPSVASPGSRGRARGPGRTSPTHHRRRRRSVSAERREPVLAEPGGVFEVGPWRVRHSAQRPPAPDERSGEASWAADVLTSGRGGVGPAPGGPGPTLRAAPEGAPTPSMVLIRTRPARGATNGVHLPSTEDPRWHRCGMALDAAADAEA